MGDLWEKNTQYGLFDLPLWVSSEKLVTELHGSPLFVINLVFFFVFEEACFELVDFPQLAAGVFLWRKAR